MCTVKRAVELNIKASVTDALKMTVVFLTSHRKTECLVSCKGHVGKEESLSFLGAILSDTSCMCLKYLDAPK